MFLSRLEIGGVRDGGNQHMMIGEGPIRTLTAIEYFKDKVEYLIS